MVNIVVSNDMNISYLFGRKLQICFSILHKISQPPLNCLLHWFCLKSYILCGFRRWGPGGHSTDHRTPFEILAYVNTSWNKKISEMHNEYTSQRTSFSHLYRTSSTFLHILLPCAVICLLCLSKLAQISFYFFHHYKFQDLIDHNEWVEMCENVKSVEILPDLSPKLYTT